MKNSLKYASTLLMGILFFSSCEKEDALEPSGADEIAFFVPEDATDAESVLRRDFYKETGVHLLFNEVLRKEYVGVDSYGEEVWKTETVNLNYIMSGNSKRLDYNFTYLETQEEKVEATAFVRERLFTHLTGILLPYSILLVSNLETYDNDSYYPSWDPVNYYAGWRCKVYALDKLAEKDEAETAELAQSFLLSTVLTIMDSRPNNEFAEFDAYSDSYYNKYKRELGLANSNDVEPLWQFGFIKNVARSYCPNAKDDRKAYIAAVLSTPEEEFAETYADYPDIIAKYGIMRKQLVNVGYEF